MVKILCSACLPFFSHLRIILVWTFNAMSFKRWSNNLSAFYCSIFAKPLASKTCCSYDWPHSSHPFLRPAAFLKFILIAFQIVAELLGTFEVVE